MCSDAKPGQWQRRGAMVRSGEAISSQLQQELGKHRSQLCVNLQRWVLNLYVTWKKWRVLIEGKLGLGRIVSVSLVPLCPDSSPEHSLILAVPAASLRGPPGHSSAQLCRAQWAAKNLVEPWWKDMDGQMLGFKGPNQNKSLLYRICFCHSFLQEQTAVGS